jgi:aspartate racemase
MGPFASAAFVETIYELNADVGAEQNKPRLVLVSDPDIPDRTTSIASGENDAVTKRLISIWQNLQAMEIERLIIPCMTAHYYLHAYPESYPEPMRRQLINLVELTIREVEQSSTNYLLLATKGSYQTRLFQHERILIPSEDDQALIHELAYRLKIVGSRPELLAEVSSAVLELAAQYGADRWISGCTEFHLLTRYVLHNLPDLARRILDPLLVIAKSWPQVAG